MKPVKIVEYTSKQKNEKKFRASNVLSEILSDTSRHWTIDEVADEAIRLGKIPERIFRSMQKKVVRAWFSNCGRQVKKNVGMKGHPKSVRVFGSYAVTRVDGDGKDCTVFCWREYELMTRDEKVSALQELFKQARAMKTEAHLQFGWCNKLCVNDGDRPIDLEEVNC